jgi:hypothetical protein
MVITHEQEVLTSFIGLDSGRCAVHSTGEAAGEVGRAGQLLEEDGTREDLGGRR